MLISTVKAMFVRDLDRLHYQISSFSSNEKIWSVDPGITNSAGNLALHIIGNLNTFIGAELGGTGYVRDRYAEFSTKHVPTELLLSKITDTKDMVIRVLDSMDESELEATYPKVVFKEEMSTAYFLVHLTTHLAYHLGQLNYYRRLFD